MGFLGLFNKGQAEASTPAHGSIHEDNKVQIPPAASLPFKAYYLGAVASIGGFLSGYESGEISGFVAMSDFLNRFAENGHFTPAREGTIVGLFSIGCLVGCLISPSFADRLGRKYSISASAFLYIVGIIIEITSTTVWAQFAMGRFVSGLGIGAMSSLVPMWQSETIPKSIRGAVVASYQLAITMGIWTAYMINWGTHETYDNSAQWRIPVGIATAFTIILGVSVLFLPESPRWAYRVGRQAEARTIMASLNGVPEDDPLLEEEIHDIEAKFAEEKAGGAVAWHGFITGPRMFYRTVLGMVLQCGQQLTGANYYFYYGTTIFLATGLKDSYETSIILGSVNVGATIFGLWIINRVGRRKLLVSAAFWMFACFFIFAFVGKYQLNAADPTSTPTAGTVMIVFACLFIVAFAITWGPLVWTIVGELYPARYRATCMALATASNWLWNFLLSFFTTFITNDISYFYGLIFGCCCFCLGIIVYFFVIETKGRSLEEVDTMYLLHVNPITSASWDAKTDPRVQKAGGIGFIDQVEKVNPERMFVDGEQQHEGVLTSAPAEA